MKTADALPLPETEPRVVFGLFRRESRLSYIALCLALWSILSYLLITHFIVMSVEIKGISMVPTLRDGQHFVLYRFPYLLRSPHSGEIVVIRDPEDNDLSIKRIIAMPHDKISITIRICSVDQAIRLYESRDGPIPLSSAADPVKMLQVSR